MKVEELAISGSFLVRSPRHEDDRGWFMEVFRENALGVGFVQANHSHSRAGVLRGLHYHAKQSDAWYVASGKARIGLAELRVRTDQPTVLTIDIDAAEPSVLFVPPGVAHGFYAVTDIDLIYWVTHYFDNSDEHGVAWNDPALSVPWGVSDPILSGRDKAAGPIDWNQVEGVLVGTPTH